MDDIRSMNLSEIEDLVQNLGEKKYRGVQIFEWLNKKLAESFDEMTDLSKAFRQKLEQTVDLYQVELVEKTQSKTDGVIKYLFKMHDGSLIESVLMKYNYGNSVCVSSQAGCRMKCAFCASADAPFNRNLTPGEIAAQVYSIQKDLGERISHAVVMGIGEPFDNYDNVLKFCNLLNHKNGLNISQRNITVSTCGIIHGISRLSQEDLSVNLAISLHAPNGELRKKIIPIAGVNGFEDLLKACKEYISKTNRRITFEYALMQGFNDSEACAKELASVLKGMLCHVNLILPNPVSNSDFKPSSKNAQKIFFEILSQSGIETTIRRKLGADIDAACGQLRLKHL